MRQLIKTLKSHYVDLVVIIIFVGLTILMTWPLTPQLCNSVIGGQGDNLYFVWLVGWFQKALFRNPLVVPTLNYPEGWNLAYNEITPAMALIGLPASLIGGPVCGYNFSLIVSFVLSGFGVYLWMRRTTGNAYAGVIAGTIFAFVPYRMSHLLGHLNLMGTQWFPFYFMYLSDLLEEQSYAWKTAVKASLFLGLIGLTSQYYLYMTLVLSAIFLCSHLLITKNKPLSRRSFGLNLLSFGLVSLPLLLIAVMPYFRLAMQDSLPQRTFEEVRVWSASPTDFFLPSPKHFLWGEWIARHFDRHLWIENTLYVGMVAVVLAIVAIAKLKGDSKKQMKLFVFMFFAAFILALGTDLHWQGHPISLSVPKFIQQWHPYEKTFIPLPGYLLFKFMPYYANMRVWMRYGIFAAMFASLLAGLGVDFLLQRIKEHVKIWAAVFMVVLILVDFYPGAQSLWRVRGRTVDAWLAEQPGEGAVMQFPISEATHPTYTFYTLIYQKPFIGGFFSAYRTPQFRRIEPILSDFPNRDSIALLDELKVQWIIVDSSKYEDFTQIYAIIGGFENVYFVADFDGQYVYELK